MRFSSAALGALFVAGALLLGSCTLQSTLTLGADKSASVRASFQLKAAARQAWSGLRDLDPTLPADPVDPALLKKSLGPGTRVSTAGETTTLDFSATDLAARVPGLKVTDSSWDLTLDRTSVRQIAGWTGWSQSPALDALLPTPGTRITEAEYRDLLVYLLGPATPEAAARLLVDASSVSLTVVAPRPIVEAPGAASVVDRTAVWRWPLVKLLALEAPIRLKLKF